MRKTKSATFRTADIIGLDTLESVAMTTYEKSKDDESIEVFKPPNIIKILIKNNYLGQNQTQVFTEKMMMGQYKFLILKKLNISMFKN